MMKHSALRCSYAAGPGDVSEAKSIHDLTKLLSSGIIICSGHLATHEGVVGIKVWEQRWKISTLMSTHPSSDTHTHTQVEHDRILSQTFIREGPKFQPTHTAKHVVSQEAVASGTSGWPTSP